MDRTFGPAFEEEKDGKRIRTQMSVIRAYMINLYPHWATLKEIENDLGYPQASISAQIRHLKKKQFGGHILEKKRRDSNGDGGTWVYRLSERPEEDLPLWRAKSTST